MIRVKKIIIPFLISIASLTGINSYAQQRQNEIKPHQYHAIQWTMEDGLSKDGINTMIKDAKGFIWFGSDQGGFCRFDGAKFKKYLPEQNNRNTINSDQIKSFTEDSLNNIWIGTDKGLSRYDFKADTFTNFSPLNNSAAAIVPIGSTKDTIFCMEPGALITVFDIRTLQRRELVKLSTDIDTKIEWNTNKSFFDARSNSIWKLSYYGQQLAVLEQIFLDNRSPKQHPWPCYRNNVRHRHNAEDMRYDSKRYSIWINAGDGLLEFSLKDQKFRIPEALNDYVKSKDYDRDVGIDIDINGRIWFATRSNGILIYDPKTETVHPLFSNQDPQKKAGEANLHIYCDRDGIVWTSNYGSFGIYELLPFNHSIKRYAAKRGMQGSLSDDFVVTIIPAAQGKMWIGTYDGINIFDPSTEKFEVLREKDLPGIRGKAIVPVHIDTVRQKAWLYAVSDTMNFYDRGSMYEMDMKTRKCRQITFRDGAKKFDNLIIDPNYIKAYKNGILVFDDSFGLFEIKEGSLFANLVLPKFSKNLTSWMALEEETRVYIKPYNALPNATFENKNGKWNKIPHLLDSVNWGSMIYSERDQTHWVSFHYKLIHYDKNFGEIKTYTEEDGYSGLAFKMILDNAGNLWFVNVLNQVGRLNVSTGIITLLSEADGYLKKDFDWGVPLAKDAQGNLYFGTGTTEGQEGLDRIYPERYSSASTSSVYLRSLTINQKPFPLSIGVNNVEKLSLRYNQNTISIETGIIDFYAIGKGHIRYKLKSGDNEEDWRYGPAYYTIRYEKLQPGKYELVFQTSNAGNEFNSAEKKLVINISPPFWQTWWFRILAVVMAIAIIYGIIQYRSRNLKQRNKQLEEKVMVRTKELKHSLENLRETQSQLIHSEKMASLGELTAGIAHEIQNPLNFVNNFSEVSNELIDEMKTELENNNKEDAIAIADDVKQNLEKILHHGKRADAIVKGMLQHSRSSTGVKEPTDINALADEYLRLAYHGLRAKDKSFNAIMKTDFDETIGNINIIPQDIGRVILNLITNAFYVVTEKNASISSAGQKYEPTVSVSTKKINDKPDSYRVEIKVRDNGNGIPQKVLDKIFQPFFTTKPTGQGTGLGLSLSYDIIKAHGGEIKAETKEGEYAEFIINLPIST